MVDRKDVYKWIQSQKGNVTIEQLVFVFSGVDPLEIARGFNMYVESKVGNNK